VKMDDPNITIEEYMRLEEEKAPRRGPREGKSTNVGGEFPNLEILKCWSLENSRRYGYIKNHKKTVKNGQTRTRERKSVQEPEAKVRKVNYGQASVKESQTLEMPRGREESTRINEFTLSVLSKEAQSSNPHGCHAGNPCELSFDPRAIIDDPMIG
ncbi:hypothetical protein Tco_0741771, partial [Tanacetum coccineum]